MVSYFQSSPRKKIFKMQTTSDYWDSKGTLLVQFLEKSATFNSERKVQKLKKSEKRIRRVRLNRNMNQMRLHDSARPHTGLPTGEETATVGWTLLLHPPYSPDLAPSDPHLFGSLKDAHRGRRFADDGLKKRECRVPTLQQRVSRDRYRAFRAWVEKVDW